MEFDVCSLMAQPSKTLIVAPTMLKTNFSFSHLRKEPNHDYIVI